MSKQCADCKQVKPLGEFGDNPRMRLGKKSYCRVCCTRQHREWRAKQPRPQVRPPARDRDVVIVEKDEALRRAGWHYRYVGSLRLDAALDQRCRQHGYVELCPRQEMTPACAVLDAREVDEVTDFHIVRLEAQAEVWIVQYEDLPRLATVTDFRLLT